MQSQSRSHQHFLLHIVGIACLFRSEKDSKNVQKKHGFAFKTTLLHWRKLDMPTNLNNDNCEGAHTASNLCLTVQLIAAVKQRKLKHHHLPLTLTSFLSEQIKSQGKSISIAIVLNLAVISSIFPFFSFTHVENKGLLFRKSSNYQNYISVVCPLITKE